MSGVILLVSRLMIINLYFPALHCVTKDSSPPLLVSPPPSDYPDCCVGAIIDMARASPALILRSRLYSKIEHKTAESDTRGRGRVRGIFF